MGPARQSVTQSALQVLLRWRLAANGVRSRDALANGRRIKCLTVVDDFSRESVEVAFDMALAASSFNGKFRDKCLNEQWFESMHQARQEIARWRRDYNEVRPHSAIGRMPPTSWPPCIAGMPAAQAYQRRSANLYNPRTREPRSGTPAGSRSRAIEDLPS